MGGAGLGFGSAPATKAVPSFQPAVNTSTSFSQPAAAPQAPPPTAPHEQDGGRCTPASMTAQPPQQSLPGPPRRPQQAVAHAQVQQGAPPVAAATIAAPVGGKRTFSEVAPPLATSAAAVTHAVRIQSGSLAPKGFVKSSLKVGGGEAGPQIVLPSGPAATAKPEAPAAWLQKRIQVGCLVTTPKHPEKQYLSLIHI